MVHFGQNAGFDKINMKRKQLTVTGALQDAFDTSLEEIETDDSSCQTV